MFKKQTSPIAVHMKLFLFHEATCGFNSRDAVKYARTSEVGKTPPYGCKPFGSHSLQLIVAIFDFLTHQDFLDKF